MITRIEATNVFCFSTFAMDVPANGALIEGGNARGKTSVLNLIRAALVEKRRDPRHDQERRRQRRDHGPR